VARRAVVGCGGGGGRGVAAENPIAVLFLGIARLVTQEQLVGFFRYFVVLALVISTLLTPPDPLSQLLLASVFCASCASSGT
jgi:sec-independent protein translocase protein TatC